MSERDPAAVRIHVRGSRLQARVTHELEHDRGKRLVYLDHGDVVPLQAGARERPLTRLRVAVQHAVRVDAGEPERHEASARL